MPSDALISGYRFNDLKRSRIVSSRSDLHEKQKTLGFPKPVKTGARSAWWPAEEVAAWVQTRIALRDNPDNSNDENRAPAAPAKPHRQRKSGKAPARKAAAPNKPNKQREHAIA
jgi:predicted DNA-binding transcriptional regulator AlpA